jgi:hypothetical protein
MSIAKDPVGAKLTAVDIARAKNCVFDDASAQALASYDHATHRRWRGTDANLIVWTMKSDTAFDHESQDPD